MGRTEFFHRQADSFAKRARECTDPKRRAKLQMIADGYEYMLDRKAAAGEERDLSHVPR